MSKSKARFLADLLSTSGHLTSADSTKTMFGASDDLQIYHDGSNSYIDDAGTGWLNIRGNAIGIDKYTGETMATFVADGAVTLYHNNSAKIATTSTGIDVTGSVTASTSMLVGDGEAYGFGDNSYRIEGKDDGANARIGFVTGSSEKMRIDSSGNVGIGNTNPNLPLTVTSNSGANAIEIRARSADDYGFIQFYNHAGTALRGQIFNHNGAMAISTSTTGTARLHIDTSGNVGIGTTAPTAKLHVEVADGAEFLKATITGNEAWAFKGASGSGSMDYVSFGLSGSTQAMAWQEDGNVGIGTNSPQSAVDLGSGSSGNRQISWHTDSTTAYGNIWQSLNGARTIIANGLKGSSSVNNGFEASTSNTWGRTAIEQDYGLIKFYTNAASATTYGTAYTPTERMRIDSSGNLLVGKATTAIGTQGIRLEGNNGKIEATRSGNVVTAFNRTSSDGTISEWMKDGTTVGSIGVTAGSIAFGQSNTALGAFNTDRILFPATAAGGVQDNAIDLGYSGGRFKDLYIAGLDVTASTYNKISSYFSGSYTSGFKFSDMNGGIWYDAGTDDLTVSAGHANSQLILVSGGSEAMRITADGDVLIGTGTNLNVLSGTPKLQIGSGTGHASLQFYSGATSVNGIYFGDTSSANTDRYDGYIEYQHANRLISFRASGVNPMTLKLNGPLLPAGDFGYHTTQEHYTASSNPSSYSTSTNITYNSSTQYWPDQGEKQICVINARAYTSYIHIKTNLTANNIMFMFRTKGYFYSYGCEEQLIGGYTYNNSVISKSNETVAGNTHSGDTYRASDGSLVLKMHVNQTGYTEGKMLVFFHAHSPSTTSGMLVTAVTQKDDGTNAF